MTLNTTTRVIMGLFLFFLGMGTCIAHTPDSLQYSGAYQGFLHPLTGLDHSLAMLSIGLLASQKEKWMAWTMPILFLVFMLIGGFLGFIHLAFPWTETGILLSVLILGVLITYPNLIPNFLILTLIALFAACHGHAHGEELLPGLSAESYASGFILATAGLHVLGFGIGKGMTHYAQWMMPLTGVSLAAASFWI